ncbi:MAG TPA: HAMP domain-containing histidine kinase [Thermoplasmatales archaeon]|nr:HAMP domain-containing histidine kinase [Thermoplasmatales archaeon]
MNVFIPLSINFILSIIILFVIMNIYFIYKRKYLLFFLIALFFISFVFLYSFIEIAYLSKISPYFILSYPVIVIFAEISIMLAQKNLISSLEYERGEEYKFLIREDIALIRGFEKICNYFIGRISTFIGIKDIKILLEDCIEKYPILFGCYIGIDEKLNTKAVEESVDELEEKRIEKLCEAFSHLLTKLIDLYAAFVPYGDIAKQLEEEVNKLDKKVLKYFIPLILFKVTLEPFIRELRGEDLKKLRIFTDIEGIYITRKGGIEFHKIYEYEDSIKEEKFIKFLHRTIPTIGNNIERRITEVFRKMPNNIKEEIYRYDFIKKLPRGILEEEKIVLTSKESMIEELIKRQNKLEEAYSRLAEAKIGKMKSDFIDIIAHELKTPLTAIKTYTDLLRKEKLGKLNKLQKEKIDKMAKNIERLTKLIDDMLQIPSIDVKELELRKEIFYLEDVISKIMEEVNEMALEKKQNISIEIEDELTVFGDKNLIEKAIKNIVVNAIKYTPENGSIKIKANRDGTFIHVSIKDTGKGIGKEYIERIFEPFYSLEEGVGLGLAIAKNIVESHDGKIWAESEKGKGSNFHILLRGEK